MQGHLSYGLAVGVVGLAGVIGYGVEVRRRRRIGPDADRRWPAWLGPAVVGATVLAAWGPPLFQQLTSSRPNLSAITNGLGPTGESGRLGPDLYGQVFWPTYGIRPFWAEPNGWLRGLGPATSVTAVLVLAALVAATVWTLRRRRRSQARLLLVAGAGVLASAVTIAAAPETVDAQSFRYLWAIGPFVWVAVLTSGVSLARPWLRRVRWQGFVAPAVVVVVALVTLAAVVGSDPTGKDLGNDAARHSRAVASLTHQLLPKLTADRPYGMVRHGATAFLSIGPGLLRNLEQHGISVNVLDGDQNAYGSGRSGNSGLAGTLVVESGATDPGSLPPDSRRVGRYTVDVAAQAKELEAAALDAIGDLPRIELTTKGQQFFDLLFTFIRQSPAVADSLEQTLGRKLTRTSLADTLRRPGRLATDGSGARLLESGALGYLVKARILRAPPTVLQLIERYEDARTSKNDTTTVYLVPAGLRVS